MKYQRNPPLVDAVQFDGDNCEAVRAVTGIWGGTLWVEDDGKVVMSLHGVSVCIEGLWVTEDLVIREGNYVMVDEDGNVSVPDSKTFESRYTVLESKG